MVDSDGIELFKSSSPTKSRSTERNKLRSSTFGKDLDLIDQLITSSLASSGYWEDCDSLVTSEYDVFGLNRATYHQNERIKCNRSKHRPLPDRTNQSSFVRTHSLYEKQKDNITKHSSEHYPREHHSDSILNTYCNDIQYVMSPRNNTDYGVPNDSLDVVNLTEANLVSCEKSHSSVYNSQSFQEVPNSPHNPGKKISKHLGEWGDSSDEEVVDGAEPKTKFEAALRRAEENNQKRMALVASKNYSTSGKVMPEWGSPIQIGSNVNGSRYTECCVSLDIPLSCATSPEISRPSDLCREVEEWLQSRPSWIDQKHQKNNPALQICFLNTSEQNLFSSMEAIVTEPQLNHTTNGIEQNDTEDNLFPTTTNHNVDDTINTVNLISDNKIDQNDSNEDYDLKQPSLNGSLLYEEENRMNSSISGRSSLLLAFESSVNLISLLNEINTYYERLLDQCRQDCYNARSVVYLQELMKNHKRFQTETQIAIMQVPKISAMQAEVERMKIPPITPNVAKMLRIDLKRFHICKNELIKFSTSQLEVIMNDMHSRIESLNESLMLSLVERDELHLEQGGKLVALEDIKSWIKELSIRSSIPQVRRQLFLNLPNSLSNNLFSDGLFPKQQTNHHVIPRKSQWMTSLFGRVSQRQALSL
ncbi:Schwannomin-interacting protein [Schistosoma japonicum]|nr:Schwannomin-interacting protein [Schistosoma japonicum]KAH8868971.1 Schwannomin-interacting protein [Schistosoma japonicum]